MIWFTCKQCGKSLGRPEESGGSLVFCECGRGNRVPWESTTPEPELAAEEPSHEPAPRSERPRWNLPRMRSRPEVRQRDPTRCLNHNDSPSEEKCAACGEAFCGSCTVQFHGKTFCGPCKNYRLHQMSRPPRLSVLAVVALVLGLLSCPKAGCFSFVSLGLAPEISGLGVFLIVLGLILPLVALGLGVAALREIDKNPGVGGRALAMTGTATAVLGLLWCLTMLLILVGKELVG